MNQIWIVDDDVISRELLTKFLQTHGYSIKNFKDGESAWDHLKNSSQGIGVVLLDRNMPGMSGIDLLKKMKSALTLKHIPVIMQTGMSRNEDVIEGYRHGASGYLVKPINMQLLLAMIQSLFSNLPIRFNAKYISDTDLKQRLVKMRAIFEIKTFSEAARLAWYISLLCDDAEKAHIGLYELMVNAIEHGNLEIGYDEKFEMLVNGSWLCEVEQRLQKSPYKERSVLVEFERQDGTTTVQITDQGQGFDFEKYLDFSPERSFHIHGRGIAMAAQLYLKHVEYVGKGNCVRIVL